MTHARTNIRKAFVEAIKDKTVAEDRVYDSRMYSMADGVLPGIIVFSTQEEVVTSTISKPHCQNRKLKIMVECYAKATNDVNGIIDDLTAEIEALVAASADLKALCKDCRLESTDIQLNSDADQPVAVAIMLYALSYRTKENGPDITV